MENDSRKSFTQVFDTIKSQWLHYLLSLDNGKLWPCLYFSDKSYKIFVFPFIPQTYSREFLEKPPETQIFELSQTFCFQGCVTFAKFLMDFLVKDGISKADAAKITEFHNILAHSVPFGLVVDHNFSQIKEMLNKQKLSHCDNLVNFYVNNPDSSKIPQYKLYFSEGKPEMELVIEEEIVSYQFCKENMRDFNEIHGNISCLANFQENPEITISIQGITKEIFSSFRMINPGKIYKTESIKNEGVKLIFYPTNKPFLLGTYQTTQDFSVPIRGVFQHKEISAELIKISVNLTVLKKLAKFIENIEVEMNFKKFYRISSTNLSYLAGSLNKKAKNSLKWEIGGNQINSENLEFNLEGTVGLLSDDGPENDIIYETFAKKDENDSELPQNDEVYKEKMKVLLENFSMPENFVVLKFKIKDVLLTNVDILPETVSIYPYKKPGIRIVKKCFAGKYYVYDAVNHDFTKFFANYRKNY